MASVVNSHWAVRYGVSVLFLVAVFLYVLFALGASSYVLLFAAVTGGYMAMNIGANDVANNVGPAVGSGAMTLMTAVVVAALCEAAGALIAGGDVVSTIKKGIINPQMVTDTHEFVWLMAGALMAGALWLNFATWMGAPVSTTHSIVGGVLGAGIAAGGMHIANWPVMGAIVASWVISPVMGGLIAAITLFFIKRLILYKQDKISAAERYVPILVALMAWAFGVYLVLKGIKHLWKADLWQAMLVGALVAIGVYVISRRAIVSRALQLDNSRDAVNSLFTIPLIFAAGLLSFAHGANDVANAVGPLAAIVDAVREGGIHAKAAIPVWVMLVGAIGLAVGLAMFGPRLIHTVGGEITELDKTRAFCIVLAAAVTVIIASRLGLPVSSTHIALGGVFGVGFLREFLKTRYASLLRMEIDHGDSDDRDELQKFLRDFHSASVEDMREMLYKAKRKELPVNLKKQERKKLKKVYKQELVKRKHLYRIVAAWIITVPVSGFLGAMLYFTIRGASFH